MPGPILKCYPILFAVSPSPSDYESEKLRVLLTIGTHWSHRFECVLKEELLVSFGVYVWKHPCRLVPPVATDRWSRFGARTPYPWCATGPKPEQGQRQLCPWPELGITDSADLATCRFFGFAN